MKKCVVTLMSFVLVSNVLTAQVPSTSPLIEGTKLLNYEKNKSALAFFKEAFDKNQKDGETIFWYGQALLSIDGAGLPTAENIKKAKELYQSSLQAMGNDPWLLIGSSHIQLLEGANINLIKQNIEVAITTTLVTKGKAKGKPNPEIINAIGRIFSETPTGVGDHRYAIDKINETISAYETIVPSPLNASLFIYKGINFLELGGEFGGDAVTAFTEASNRDPKNAYAYYKIGKIYQSQNNKESFDEYFKKSLDADVNFPLTYFANYLYYADVNTDIAKQNLDSYLKLADKDPALDIFNADYLFRAGQYDASLEKAKALEASIGVAALPRLGVLLAYNYDRKGDSTQAKTYIEQFLKVSPADQIVSADYDLAVKVISRFTGNQVALAALLEKAIAADTIKVNKLKYYKLGYEMLEKAGMYADELKWYINYAALRNMKDEVYYYKMASIALNAKNGPTATIVSKEYIAAFPDKPNGYSFNVKGARLIDTANNTGMLLEAVNTQNQFLLKDITKYKQTIVNNYYTLMDYYSQLKQFDQAIVFCDKVLELIPGEAQTISIKEKFTKNFEIMKKMQGGTKPAADSTSSKKG